VAVQNLLYMKTLRVAGAVYSAVTLDEISSWRFEGIPSHGQTPPTSWANPANTTAGGLQQTAPAAGSQQWLKDILVSGAVNTNANFRAVLYDRLAHVSGLSGTSTSTQTISSGPMTVSRWGPNYSGLYTNPDAITGDGNEILVEIYTALGATPQTITATYTNSVGTSGQVTQAVTIPTGADRTMRLPLAAGDTGVQSVTSVILSGSTGTTGNFGVVIAHRHAEFTPSGSVTETLHPLFAGSAQEQAEILTGACLYFTSVCTTTSTSFLMVNSFLTLVDN
jgi:hypothetical protein